MCTITTMKTKDLLYFSKKKGLCWRSRTYIKLQRFHVARSPLRACYVLNQHHREQPFRGGMCHIVLWLRHCHTPGTLPKKSLESMWICIWETSPEQEIIKCANHKAPNLDRMSTWNRILISSLLRDHAIKLPLFVLKSTKNFCLWFSGGALFSDWVVASENRWAETIRVEHKLQLVQTFHPHSLACLPFWHVVVEVDEGLIYPDQSVSLPGSVPSRMFCCWSLWLCENFCLIFVNWSKEQHFKSTILFKSTLFD